MNLHAMIALCVCVEWQMPAVLFGGRSILKVRPVLMNENSFLPRQALVRFGKPGQNPQKSLGGSFIGVRRPVPHLTLPLYRTRFVQDDRILADEVCYDGHIGPMARQASFLLAKLAMCAEKLLDFFQCR